jgi:hypothetical protein
MSIAVTTNVGAHLTTVSHTHEDTTQYLTNISIEDVRELHAELGKVIEHADKPAEPWAAKPKRRTLGKK